MQLTERQARYAKWILDKLEGDPPAKLEGARGRVLTFLGDDGQSIFLDALRAEIAYDRSCGRAGRVGPLLLAKLEGVEEGWVYHATLPESHPLAFESPDDNCRCSNCARQPEPCAECRSYSNLMAELK
jgi:hypothetical protein